MDDLVLGQQPGEENEEYVKRLKRRARATPFQAHLDEERKQKDSLAIVFNLNHLQVEENPIDYGFRGSIPLVTEGVEADEHRRVRIRKDKPVTIPADVEEGVPRGYLKIENRTGRRQGMLSRPLAEDSEEIKQVVLLRDAASGVILGVVRPGAIYFGEPPAGDLILECVDTEALVSYVAFPGSP